MKKHHLSALVLAFVMYFIVQSQPVAATTVSTDTVYYVDFKSKPTSFGTASSDIFTASSANYNKKTLKYGITFNAGPNGQRINLNPNQSASQYGSSATTYVSATSNDDGSTAGAFSFLPGVSGSASIGGFIILPEVQGPVDITVWSCSANTGNTQSYKILDSIDGGTIWTALGTTSLTDLKKIHKNTFSFTQNSSANIKLQCTTGSNANCNLYIYDVLMTKRPYIELSSAIGTDLQTVSTLETESIENIIYTWGSIANTANVVWTGTADANTPPTGITVTTDATAKTVTISGTPTVLGTYSYSITSTNGTIVSNTLSGNITVVNTPVPLIKLTSVAGTNIQKVTSGITITDVQYTWGGSATDAQMIWTGTASSATAPDGIVVTKDSPNEKVTISGTPTTVGAYGWSITSSDGTLTSPTLTGTLTVTPPPSITLTSDITTCSQTVGFCQAITPIVFTYGGSATSLSFVWTGTNTTLPAGITVTTDATNKTVTLSGMPYQTGSYNFSATSTDGTLTSTAIGGSIVASATTNVLASFPGAVGYGSHATGGRTGTVYHVTNLDDSGTGSFRDAVSSSNRIIIFDVSGYITLKTAVSCKSNLTIAGQTAPGAGIGFRGGEISFANQQNIICRHIRIVPGSETVSTGDDALSLYLAQNVIMDHCTFEFAPWNNIDGVSDNYTVYPVTAITLQNCIDANPTGQQFGGHCESVIAQWTFYRNLFANSHNRNPLAKINDQFINNVEYNNEAGYTTHSGTSFKHDIVNNYFIWGPASGSNFPWFQMDGNQSIYNPGNLCDNNKDGALNGATTAIYWYSATGTILTSPWSPLTATIPTVDATSAYRTVVSKVGTLPLSQLDSLIINQVKTLGSGTSGYTTGTTGPVGGLYTDQTQTGLPNNGYGNILSGTKETDTDNDGMPDYWELALGSDINTNDAMQIASNGYTNIENYMNWIADLHATTYVNASFDIDLSQYAGGFASVTPTYSVFNTKNGNETLMADGHTVHFVPTTDFSGIASFQFTVAGSDNTSYTDSIKIVISGSAPYSPAPVLATNFIPADLATNTDTLNLATSWTAGANTTWYNVYGGTDKDNLAALASFITAPNYTWSQLTSGTVYYWRVDALNSTTKTTGSVLSFTTKYPTPGKVTGMLPSDQTINADTPNLALSWTTGTNTTSYNVYGGTDKNNLTSLANISTPNYTWPKLTSGTVYYWRVDASNPSATTAGDTISFTTKYPNPDKVSGMLPSDQAVNIDTLNLALSWTAGANTTSYNVYGGTDKNNLISLTSNITVPNFSLTALTPGTVYYWRVDALNPSATTTGNAISFTTKYRTPGIVTGMLPADQSTNADSLNLTLSWTAGANTATFSIYMGTAANSLTLKAENITTTSLQITGLSGKTKYYWRVDAVNGTAITTGNVISFTTLAALKTSIQELVAKTLTIYPNPFTEKLSVRFSLYAKEQVNVAVYDISGELVRILEDAVLAAGSYELNWDGKGQGGQQVHEGIYLLLMKVGNSHTTKKINYMKQ